VRDIINEYVTSFVKKRLEQQKGRQNFNVCSAEENLEEY